MTAPGRLRLVPTLVLWAATALLAPSPAAAQEGAWQWPLPGEPTVARGFDPPAQQWTVGHRGVDLRAAAGTPVRAAGDGIVAFAGLVAGRPVVSVQHGALRTTYEPVVASVRAGERVAGGSAIGTLVRVGGHCLPLACLHWGLRRGQEYLDPLRLVHRAPPRLLPLWGETAAPSPSGTPRLAATPASTAARAAPPPARDPEEATGSPWQRAVAGGVAGLGTAAAATAAALRRRRP